MVKIYKKIKKKKFIKFKRGEVIEKDGTATSGGCVKKEQSKVDDEPRDCTKINHKRDKCN